MCSIQDTRAIIEAMDADKAAHLLKGQRFNAELAELDWGRSLRDSAVTQLAYFWGAMDPEVMLAVIEGAEDESHADTVRSVKGA